ADARAMESAGADSLWLDDEGYDPWLLLAGMATVTSRIRLIVPISSAERRDSENLGVRVATLSRLSRGRTALAVTGVAESSAGATGIIVPLDPRLLDLLRNGDEEEDRSDLGLAQG